MSIALEIDRISSAKADIAQAIEDCGVVVSTSLLLDDYAALVRSIPAVDKSWLGQSLIDESTATLYKRYFTSAGVWRTDSGSRSFFVDCSANTRYIITAANPELTIFRVASIPYGTSDTLPSQVQSGKIVRFTSSGVLSFTTDANAKGLVVQVNAGIADARTTGLSIFEG